MRDAPIIESLLDTDFYKFTMGQSVLYRFGPPDERRCQTVRYAMTCRTKGARLAELVDEQALREQLAHVRTLRLWPDEQAFLKSAGHLDAIYADFLGGLTLPEPAIEREGDGYRIEVEGDWCQAIFWETYVLSIVNELYGRGLARERGRDPMALWDEGDRRLEAKIARLKDTGARIIEFGTRRRWCRDWQEHVINVMSAKLPKHLAGTSNVAQAKRYGLKPIGTMAHELFMAQAALAGDDDLRLRVSQGDTLDLWSKLYGDELSIALTDTFGSDAFFRDFSGARAKAWRGVRHDSGDPFVFGDRVIRFYAEQRIDPRIKTIVFSDGLDVETILKLHERFDRRIGLLFGWGTSLTNDVGLPTLSLVMKIVEAFGRPTVKLSDDAGKHCGPSDEVARYQRVFA